MVLTERSKQIMNQAIDEWFLTRPRLRAALEEEFPSIQGYVYEEVSKTPGFAALQQALDTADSESDAITGIMKIAATALPLIIMAL